MSCNNCKTSKAPRGCKNNGLCLTNRCSQRTTFDFLANINSPNKTDLTQLEISFKNGRKEYYRAKNLAFRIGEKVVVGTDKGFDIGMISLKGELVTLQKRLYKKDINEFKILRKATIKDLEIWKYNIQKEEETLLEVRKVVKKMDLKMKISDVEYQADGKKISFYYIADKRIDFRELIKILASNFGTRIQMRQIGIRQESAKIGGIGDCGRELCCSTWMKDFRSVNIGAARYQQLSLNPDKLTGQCGKLKCCLNYELDMYLSELKNFPDFKIKLVSNEGTWGFQKADIFSGKLWYFLMKDPNNIIEIEAKKVLNIINENKKGNQVSISKFLFKNNNKQKKRYEGLMQEGNINRFDKIKI